MPQADLTERVRERLDEYKRTLDGLPVDHKVIHQYQASDPKVLSEYLKLVGDVLPEVITRTSEGVFREYLQKARGVRLLFGDTPESRQGLFMMSANPDSRALAHALYSFGLSLDMQIEFIESYFVIKKAQEAAQPNCPIS